MNTPCLFPANTLVQPALKAVARCMQAYVMRGKWLACDQMVCNPVCIPPDWYAWHRVATCTVQALPKFRMPEKFTCAADALFV